MTLKNKNREILSEFAIISILFSLVFILLLQNSPGFWTFDDGEHLNFAVNHSIIEYFTNSSVVRLQSWANLTPWIFLFYKFNLTLFGLDSSVHYIHIATIIAISAVATYELISLKFDKMTAFFSSVFFILGLPTACVSGELMSAHYAYGLLFSILCLYFFITYSNEASLKIIFPSCFFYAAALMCKEIYIPLGLFLFLLCKGSLKERLLKITPFLVILLLYMFIRYFIFGRFIGGYNTLSADGSGLFFSRIHKFLNIPWIFSGGIGERTWAAWIYIFSILIAVFSIGRKMPIILFIGSAMLCAPLYPLTLIPGLNDPNRYFFGFWWGFSILMVIGFSEFFGRNSRLFLAICIAFSLFLYYIQKMEFNEKLRPIALYQGKMYDVAINLNSNEVLLPMKPFGYYKNTLNFAINAYKNNNKLSEFGAVIGNKSDLCKAILFGKSIFMLADDGEKISMSKNKEIDDIFKLMEYFPRNQKDGVLLDISLELNDKYLLWDFGPAGDGQYSISFDGSDYIDFLKSGFIANGIQKPIVVSIKFSSKENWIAFSPDLLLNQGKDFAIKWSGYSEIKNNLPCN